MIRTFMRALRGEERVVSVLRSADRIGISSISLGELLSGFKAGRQEVKNREELMEFLDSPRVEVYAVDDDTAEFYAEILTALRGMGRPIPTNDIWIAAVAFQYGLKLFTRDAHFRSIPGLSLLS